MKSILALLCILASTQALGQQTGLNFQSDVESVKQRQMDLEQALSSNPQAPVGSITQKDLDSVSLCMMKLQSNARQYQINITQFDVRVSANASDIFIVSGFGSTPYRNMTFVGSECKDGQLIEATGRQ
ncbi:MAG: hypothetical protein K2Q26_12400 [Bdellovibrionales bacterium]|nr:hypothetical protein [Bdellovibrionales bacterium]